MCKFQKYGGTFYQKRQQYRSNKGFLFIVQQPQPSLELGTD